jgi:hypothetical protein
MSALTVHGTVFSFKKVILKDLISPALTTETGCGLMGAFVPSARVSGLAGLWTGKVEDCSENIPVSVQRLFLLE